MAPRFPKVLQLPDRTLPQERRHLAWASSAQARASAHPGSVRGEVHVTLPEPWRAYLAAIDAALDIPFPESTAAVRPWRRLHRQRVRLVRESISRVLRLGLDDYQVLAEASELRHTLSTEPLSRLASMSLPRRGQAAAAIELRAAAEVVLGEGRTPTFWRTRSTAG